MNINLDSLFDQFVLRFGWFALKREQYIQLADIFLNVSTPEAIIYGKYITHQNDFAIYSQYDSSTTSSDVTDCPEIVESTTKKRGTSVKKTIKAKRTKKEVISNDVVAGDVI